MPASRCLRLDRLYVVYPGAKPYVLRPGVEVLPLALTLERAAGFAGGGTRIRREARAR